MREKAKPAIPLSRTFWILAAYIVIVFLTGGGSRGDILSLMILRPLAIVVCGVGVLSLTREHIWGHRFALAVIAATFLLLIVHLLPLPPALWSSLPGRELVSAIDGAAGLRNVWRPISLVPWATWNALFALMVPLAVFLLGIQLSSDECKALLPVVLAVGILSALAALLQITGGRDSFLYLYRITNEGAAVGLFSNRNHHAIMLAMLLPMFVVFATGELPGSARVGAAAREWMAIVGGALVVPLLMITGSRIGLAAAVMGLAATPLIYRRTQQRRSAKSAAATWRSWRIWLVCGALIAIAGLTILLSRAETVRRLMETSSDDGELRFAVWGPIADLAWRSLPLGTGAGTFAEAFKIIEPDALLRPTYLNHAHNDWLELWMTTGLPGLAILAVALVGFFLAIRGAFKTRMLGSVNNQFQRLGGVIIILAMIGSITDYPLRTPSLACLAVISYLWIRAGRAEEQVSSASGTNASGFSRQH